MSLAKMGNGCQIFILPYKTLHFMDPFISRISSTKLQFAQSIPAMGAFLLSLKHSRHAPVVEPLIKYSLCLERSSPGNNLVISAFSSASTSYFPSMGFPECLFNTAPCQESHIEYSNTSLFCPTYPIAIGPTNFKKNI